MLQHCVSSYLSSNKLFFHELDNIWAIKNWLFYFDRQVVWATKNFLHLYSNRSRLPKFLVIWCSLLMLQQLLEIIATMLNKLASVMRKNRNVWNWRKRTAVHCKCTGDILGNFQGECDVQMPITFSYFHFFSNFEHAFVFNL